MIDGKNVNYQLKCFTASYLLNCEERKEHV